MWQKIRLIIAAGPDLCLAWLFWYTWVYPEAFAHDMVAHLVAVIVLEFLVLHSTAFMLLPVALKKTMKQSVIWILGFCLIYSLFAWGLSDAFDTWFPLIAMWGLTLNRLIAVILPGANHKEELNKVWGKWIFATTIYMFLIFLHVLPIPELGVTGSLSSYGVSGSNYKEPYYAIAIGGLYFFLVGLLELKSDWMKKVNFVDTPPPG